MKYALHRYLLRDRTIRNLATTLTTRCGSAAPGSSRLDRYRVSSTRPAVKERSAGRRSFLNSNGNGKRDDFTEPGNRLDRHQTTTGSGTIAVMPIRRMFRSGTRSASLADRHALHVFHIRRRNFPNFMRHPKPGVGVRGRDMIPMAAAGVRNRADTWSVSPIDASARDPQRPSATGNHFPRLECIHIPARDSRASEEGQRRGRDHTWVDQHNTGWTLILEKVPSSLKPQRRLVRPEKRKDGHAAHSLPAWGSTPKDSTDHRRSECRLEGTRSLEHQRRCTPSAMEGGKAAPACRLYPGPP